MELPTIDDLELRGKRVLIRVDFNVPVENGTVTDNTRIRASLPTLEKVLAEGGRPILCSHRGRPNGKRVSDLSLEPVAKHLSTLIENPVIFVESTVGRDVQERTESAEAGTVMVLENTRFNEGEKANDDTFARELASLADVYVNDAFGTAHRAHASTAGVAKHVDERAIGYLMETELEHLTRAAESPESPLVVTLGGSKVSDKIGVIDRFLDAADHILIGGAMTYTFLKSQGQSVGNSLVEDDKLDVARDLLERGGVKLALPLDHRVASEPSNHDYSVSSEQIPEDQMGLDIGPETVDHYWEILTQARTIIWNGPMGVFEEEPYAEGTNKIAQAVAIATGEGAFSVVGGGDSVAAVNQSGFQDRISHISTGGGAMLTFLEGSPLPGLEAIRQ